MLASQHVSPKQISIHWGRVRDFVVVYVKLYRERQDIRRTQNKYRVKVFLNLRVLLHKKIPAYIPPTTRKYTFLGTIVTWLIAPSWISRLPAPCCNRTSQQKQTSITPKKAHHHHEPSPATSIDSAKLLLRVRAYEPMDMYPYSGLVAIRQELLRVVY